MPFYSIQELDDFANDLLINIPKVGGRNRNIPACVVPCLECLKRRPIQPVYKILTVCPKKLFDDKPTTIFKFDVQTCMNRKRFGVYFAAYARQMQIQHFDRPNKPRAKPACLVALNDHSVKFHNLPGPILL